MLQRFIALSRPNDPPDPSFAEMPTRENAWHAGMQSHISGNADLACSATQFDPCCAFRNLVPYFVPTCQQHGYYSHEGQHEILACLCQTMERNICAPACGSVDHMGPYYMSEF